MYATNRQSRSVVDVRAASALGKLAGVAGLLRSGLRGSAEDVARVQAEQQGEHQNDQSGAAANRDLPAVPSTAAHLRRVELGTFVVFHVSPPASNRDARLDRQHSRERGTSSR